MIEILAEKKIVQEIYKIQFLYDFLKIGGSVRTWDIPFILSGKALLEQGTCQYTDNLFLVDIKDIY